MKLAVFGTGGVGETVGATLVELGHDVGDLTGARALEQYLPLWARLYGALKTMFNVKIVR